MTRESRAAHALRVTAQREKVKQGFAKKRASERKAQRDEVSRRERGGRHRAG